MKKNFFSRFRLVTILMFCCAFLLSCEEDSYLEENPSNDQSELDNKIRNIDRYIIIFNDELLDEETLKLAENYARSQEIILIHSKEILGNAGLDEVEIDHIYSNTIRGVSANLDKKEVILLKNDKSIKSVEKDRYLLFAPPCGTKNGGPCEDGTSDQQQIPYGVTRVGGISNFTGTGVAWVIDSGIDIDHPDLNVDIDRGYRAPEVAPFLLENPFDDDNGHGTHVAGTIGAINNEFGVIGVAPGATVIPIKVLGENGYGWWSDVIAGIDYVGANGKPGDVANLSIGGVTVDAVDEAVNAASSKGIWFIIAAGNNGDDANNYSPARANGDFIITVSAIDESDNWATFSNYGNPPVDFAAPGVYVNSTFIDGKYSYMSGTSMAAPHAAGVILLAGRPGSDGTYVKGDVDGSPDPIIFFNEVLDPVPNAEFSYSTTMLAVQFTDNSTDSDDSVLSWSWNFGDGNTSSSQNPEHTYASAGTYSVSLTVTDDAGNTGSISKDIAVSAEEPEPGNVMLSASGYKVKGQWNTNLSWTPALTSAKVDIYRNGNFLVSINNIGNYTDATTFKGGGSLIYKVCAAGTTTCSNEVMVMF